MLQIDGYAHTNRLRAVHPGEKTVFALATLLICLAFSSVQVSLAVLLLTSVLVTAAAGIPCRQYLKLLAVPASFLALGAAAVAVSFTGPPGSCLFGFALGGFYAGVTPGDLALAANVFLKSLGAVSCLFFLSLTTPLNEVVSLLRRVRLPSIFIELLSLVYRFIFVLAETADSIFTSQSARLGYRNFKTGFFSLGLLAANLLVRAYQRSQQLYTALSARCYNGEIRVLEREYPVSARNVAFIIGIDLLLIVMGSVEKGLGIGG